MGAHCGEIREGIREAARSVMQRGGQHCLESPSAYLTPVRSRVWGGELWKLSRQAGRRAGPVCGSRWHRQGIPGRQQPQASRVPSPDSIRFPARKENRVPRRLLPPSTICSALDRTRQQLIILTQKSIPCPRKDLTQPKGKEEVSAERGELGSIKGKANPSSAVFLKAADKYRTKPVPLFTDPHNGDNIVYLIELLSAIDGII